MPTPNGNKKPPQRETLPFLVRERNRVTLEQMAEGPFLIAYGSVAGGYEFVGPFPDVTQAIDFAEMFLSAYHWEIATLQNPEEVKRG